MKDSELFEPLIIEKDEYQKDEIYFREIIEKYAYHWKWLLLGIIISCALTYFMLQRTSNKYSATTLVIIDNQENSGSSELAAFQDLGVFGNMKNPLENEIGILNSQTLMNKVVRNLALNISFHDPEKMSNSEIYGEKVPIKINFFIPDSIFYVMDTSFLITSISNTHYKIKNNDSEIERTGAFGKNLSIGKGDINITPKDSKKFKTRKPIEVRIEPLERVVNYYNSQIEIIPPIDNTSTLLRLNIIDPVLTKAKKILDELMDQYNKDLIEYRSMITENTDTFIMQRIEDISNELDLADEGVEVFKTKNKLTDMSYEANLILDSNSELGKQILELNSQIRLVDYLLDYIKLGDKLIPSNIGLNDPVLNENVVVYNKLLMEKNRVLKNSSELNPTVVNLGEQLSTILSNIDHSLINSRSSIMYSLDQALIQENQLNYKRYRAPKQEREIQDIQRKQQIIESLYLYLLQKREENAIKMGATSPQAKIIDRANGISSPVSPSRKKFYFLALVIGLVIPIIIIFTISVIDYKIHTIEDVEKVLKAPILGDIPKSKIKSKKLISSNDNDSLAESFRILRTNLNYMLSSKSKESKIIFVTSTIASEGKTIISLNLSSSIASMDKKVLLIGADLRKPKFSHYVDIKKGVGLTRYLVDDKLKLDDIIETNENYNFDMINSWEIPPNPSYLLSNGRFDILLDESKKYYDFIIVDTAPVGLVTDTMLLNHHADLLLYVVRANYLDKRLLRIPQKLYKNNRLKNMAVVVNSTNHKKSGYGYGYGYN